MRQSPTKTAGHHQHGVAAILAMMFLVIFSSLAVAMAIVAQGNLSTADAHIKINRSLAAAETGMQLLMARLQQAAAQVTTREGLINQDNAPALWDQTRALLVAQFQNEAHNLEEPYEIVTETGTGLHVGPIAVGPDAPRFNATLTPHPIADEDYGSNYYQRSPYSDMHPAVSSAAPLDATWIRVRVEAADGAAGRQIIRSIQVDFRIDRKIEFAILSKNRLMIGRNVMIEGPIGSRFVDTHLENGHPVQMLSDFRGLNPTLDAQCDALVGTLILNDANGDNRINLAMAVEVDGIDDPQALDTNDDGYIDDYDFFMAYYDANGDGDVTGIELGADTDVTAAQFLELIDTFNPDNPGYNDGVISDLDRYAKIRGNVKLSADVQGWNDGAAGGAYQDYFAGPINPDYGDVPLTFQASDTDIYEYGPDDFDVSSFAATASGDFDTQAQQQAALHDPGDPESPQPLGRIQREAVPFGAAHPYDNYVRSVYENMTFINVTIPRGNNGLFVGCTFIGVTFIDTTPGNGDVNFNYAGMQEADGTPRFPDITVEVEGQAVSDTKPFANNVRFHNCTFEGSVVANVAPNYTHVRNKLAFTGTTRFVIDESTNLNDDEKELYKRSTILAPHYSIEMGTFVDPTNPNETVELWGTIVAGVLDMRGQVTINGTIITTFEPASGEGPVVGDTTSQFNTTLGHFDAASGDLESEMPANGAGVIKLRYDPTLALPDGILGPIQIEPVMATYFEGGAGY